MKKLFCFLTSLFVMFSLTFSSVFAQTIKCITITDSILHNTINNAEISFLDLEENITYTYYSNENGVVDLTDDYDEICDRTFYVSAVKNGYKGYSCLTINDDVENIEMNFESASISLISTRGGTDWNQLSSSYVGDYYVPIARIPTYGGLHVGATFEKSYGYSISASSGIINYCIVSKVFTSETTINDKSDNSDASPRWFCVRGKFAKYKVVEELAGTNTKRTRYFLSGHCLDLKYKYKTRAKASTLNCTKSQRIWTFTKGTKYSIDDHEYSYGNEYSYDETGSFEGPSGTYNATFSVTMSVTGTSKMSCRYGTVGKAKYNYDIGDYKILVY